MEKEYLDRKTNSSTTKHSFGSSLLGKSDKKSEIIFSVPFSELHQTKKVMNTNRKLLDKLAKKWFHDLYYDGDSELVEI